MGLKIGFGVRQWASVETLYAWTWVQAHFIKEAYLCDDELFICHVNNNKEHNSWSRGGPILPELNIVMQQYRHTVVEVEGNNAGAALIELATQKELDVLIVGVREKRVIRRTLGNTTDYVVHNAPCPCLVIRPKTAIGDMFRLKTRLSGDITPREVSVECDSVTRRVAIAFDMLQTGQQLFQWAADKVLHVSDSIVTVRSCTQKLFNKARLCSRFDDQANEDEQLAGRELQGFHIVNEVDLKGDPRQTLITFVETERIDLLIIARSSLHPLFKGLGGTNISKTLYHRSPCPCLVVPLALQKGLSLLTEDLLTDQSFEDFSQQIIIHELQSPSDESSGEVVFREKVQMSNQGCQTDVQSKCEDDFYNVKDGITNCSSVPTEHIIKVHRTIETLNEKLRQKDALIDELRKQLKDMQCKISFIMDEVANSSVHEIITD